MSNLIQIQIRRDTAANWASVNPVLASAEPALETDTGKLKFGDGVQNYNDLPYFAGQSEIQKIAGENIAGGRAVVMNGNQIFHFDPLNLAHYGRIIGISKTSGLTGSIVTISISGIANGFSGLVPDSLQYAGTNGQISNVPNIVGINQIVGVSLSSTEIIIEQKSPIIKI